ncbi:polyprenyl synthetase family protein [Alsobacter sp. SYSU BS001988]
MTDQTSAVESEAHARPKLRRGLEARTPRQQTRPLDEAPFSLDYLRSIIQRRLALLVPSAHVRPQRVHSAIRYSLLAPGKRIRPMLCVLTAHGAGRTDSAALDAGCAIELVHTASLVLDDLPAMDDAALRRGQACAHLHFDESTAILSAIAMLNRAFGLLSTIDGVDDRTRTRLVARLSGVVGSAGLVAGQDCDLHDRAIYSDVARVEALNRLKTGVLFVAAVEFGGLVAGLCDDDLEKLARFGETFGLAFQTADDIVDARSTPEEAGKDVRQDGGKPTVVSLAGVDEARRRVAGQLVEARDVLSSCSFDIAPLDGLLDAFERKLAL